NILPRNPDCCAMQITLDNLQLPPHNSRVQSRARRLIGLCKRAHIVIDTPTPHQNLPSRILYTFSYTVLYIIIVQCTSVKVTVGEKPRMTSSDSDTFDKMPIWARPERPAHAQHPTLNRAQIIRAAIELADAEGAQALSMRRLAAKLGAGTMSLYWYLSSKQDLIDLVLDAVYSEIDLPLQPSDDWRA